MVKECHGHTTTIKQLARLGAAGAHPANIERDFTRATAGLEADMAIMYVDIPTKSGGSWPILAPHLVFAALHEARCLEKALGCGMGNSEFWQQSVPHPAKHEANNDLIFPLRMHGDGAESFRDRSVTFTSWSGLTHGITWENRFLICAIADTEFIMSDGKNVTLQRLGELIRDSFNIIYDGRWPLRELDGRVNSRAGLPLAGGWRGALIYTDGDLKYNKEFYGMEHSYLSNSICHQCGAHRTSAGLDYSDPDGSWKNTLLSAAEVKQAFATVPFVALRGWEPTCITHDLLHLVFLGVARDLMGSILSIITDANILTLPEAQGHWRAWCRQVKYTPHSDAWTSRSLRPQARAYPHMKYGKAYDTKMLVRWAATSLPLPQAEPP